MVDPLVIGLTKEYITKNDKDSKNPTIWIIGSFDSFTQSKLVASFIDISIDKEGKAILDKNKQAEHPDFMIVRYGLKGFKNFGKIEFKTSKIKLFEQDFDIVSDEVLKIIPLDIIHELAGVIWSGNRVDEELRKN